MAKTVHFINFIQNRFYIIKSLEQNLRDAKFVETNVRKFIAAGVPVNKTIIGMPFKGALFNMSIVQKSMGYNEICNELSSVDPSQWKRSYLSECELTMLENQQDNLTIVFESSRFIANKMRLAMKRGLGGVLTGSIIRDDYEGKCVIDNDTFIDFKPAKRIQLRIPQRRTVTFPLLKTIIDAIMVTLDEMEQEATKYQMPVRPIDNPIVASSNATNTINTTTQGNGTASNFVFHSNFWIFLICFVFLMLLSF